MLCDNETGSYLSIMMSLGWQIVLSQLLERGQILKKYSNKNLKLFWNSSFNGTPVDFSDHLKKPIAKFFNTLTPGQNDGMFVDGISEHIFIYRKFYILITVKPLI